MSLSLVDVKDKILEGIKANDDEYMVIIKGSKDTNVQDVLNVIAKFKTNEIDNITLGISKNDLEDDSDTKEKVNLPLLRKL